jgi:membrane associated rhomboid family serine protease
MRGALRAIILINVAVYLLQQVMDLSALALWPAGEQFRPWQLITYAFLHGDLLHLFFNMFVLYVFGRALQARWGSARFATYYLASCIAAAATQLAATQGSWSFFATVGASGGVFGVLLAFALFHPRERVIILPIPIPLPAWLFVTLYGGLELFLGVTGAQEGVAHFAHLGGMLGGALLLLHDRIDLSGLPPAPHRPPAV